MLRIAIVEDEKECQASLIEHLSKYETEHEENFVVRTFFDGIDILDDYSSEYDVIFLDIHMKFQDGMTTAKKIRELDPNVIIVFITALAQYAIDGYKVNALDFILKPVVYEQLEGTMDKIRKTAKKYQKSKEIIVSEDGAKRKIETDSIYYIEVVGHIIVVHSSYGVFEQRGKSLRSIAEDFRDCNFTLSGQSQLVNLKYVDKIDGDTVFVNGEEIYLSRSRKKPFLAAFAEYVGMEI
ncbi:MAG: LytTR family DNA-binding domain-containing protein [Lachnospiraceae bacterium]|nr:LytTR family DNA-binding domain-containing protein [Lachnospiraceae bacterium]